jgi:hypothetical protein
MYFANLQIRERDKLADEIFPNSPNLPFSHMQFDYFFHANFINLQFARVTICQWDISLFLRIARNDLSPILQLACPLAIRKYRYNCLLSQHFIKQTVSPCDISPIIIIISPIIIIIL